jgi:hypothetical protein
MSIIVNNGVQNILGTPGAISGVFSERPSAIDIAPGTLYFSTDTAAIYQVVAGSWILYTGGGGGGSSTGVNGLNGTTNIGLGGTLANATTILGAGFDLTINNAGKLIMDAAYWNFSNNNAVDTFKSDSVQTFIGCETQAGSGVSFVFDRTNQNIKSKLNGVNIGLNLDFANNTYTFGAVLAAGSSFIVDNLNGYIFAKNGIGQTTGFNLDMIGQVYQFGDINGGNTLQLGISEAFFTKSLFINYNDIFIKIGDYNTNANQTLFIVNDFNQTITTSSFGAISGLNFNYVTNVLQLINSNNYGFQQAGAISAMGDINNASTAFVVDISGFNIYAYSNATENGIKLNFSNNIYSFGDFGFSGYGLTFDIGSATANLFCSQISILTGNASGFFATSNVSVMGDVDGNGNSTIFEVDDNQQSLIASGNLISTLGLGTSDRLKIRIGGTDYLIVLETA